MQEPLDLIQELAAGVVLCGRLERDVPVFLNHHGRRRTAAHSAAVAAEASQLAKMFGQDPNQAEQAGWLHDISAVIPPEERIAAATAWSIPVLAEEEAFPLIVHQKLSATMAQQIFGVSDTAVLDAIGCHTTLRAHATELDTVIFVADKIKWDLDNDPPYLDSLLDALSVSLDAAAYAYVDYMWQRRHELRVIHPWLIEAHEYLAHKLSRNVPKENQRKSAKSA
jgi:predicted HD superfamily hydrolase involved in NAD metabolism